MPLQVRESENIFLTPAQCRTYEWRALTCALRRFSSSDLTRYRCSGFSAVERVERLCIYVRIE